MASLKCQKCGKGIHYHGIPNETVYYYFPIETWKSFPANTPVCRYKLEKPTEFYTVWRCDSCGSVHFFKGYDTKIERVYEPLRDPLPPTSTDAKLFRVLDDEIYEEAAEKGYVAKDLEDLGGFYNEFATVGDDFVNVHCGGKLDWVSYSYAAIEFEQE